MKNFVLNLPSIHPTQITIIVGKSSIATARAINEWLDTVRSSGFKKDKETCEAIGNAIKKNPALLSYVEAGAIDYATLSNYAQGAQRAFWYEMDWTPRAFQSVQNGGLPPLPWSRRARSDATAVNTDAVITLTENNSKKERSRAILSRTIIDSLSQIIEIMTTHASDLTTTERSALLTLQRTLKKLQQ